MGFVCLRRKGAIETIIDPCHFEKDWELVSSTNFVGGLREWRIWKCSHLEFD